MYDGGLSRGCAGKCLSELRKAGLEADGTAVLEEAMGAAGGADESATDPGVGIDKVHGVGEGDLEGTDLRHGEFDFNGVFEGGGFLVDALDGDDRRDNTLGFHAVEAIAYAVHPIDARLVHDADIVGVVRDAHAVALVVFDFVSVGFHVG